MKNTQQHAPAVVARLRVSLVLTCLAAGGNILAGMDLSCSGGSIVRNSNGSAIGCAFNTWTSKEQQICNGATVFAGPTVSNCRLCVTAPYDSQIAQTNFAGLTLTPAADAGSNAPTEFRCLKCAQPPDGLAAWWTLDESASVRDSTGFVVSDGIRYGGTTAVPGRVGNAAQFNGVNQYIEVPNDAQLNVGRADGNGVGDFSIDAWIKIDPAANASGIRVIAEKRTLTNQYRGYSFYLYNRYLGLQLADDLSGPVNFGAPALVVPADGQWHFVAVSVSRTTSGATAYFTLDNQPSVAVTSASGKGDLSNSGPLRIGMRTIDNGGAFNGTIDEVEFFHRAVSANEWQSIKAAGPNGKCRMTPSSQNYPSGLCRSLGIYGWTWVPCNMSTI